MLIRADKGNTSVLVYKQEYLEERNCLIQDERTYTCLSSQNPVLTSQKNNSTLCQNLPNNAECYKSLICHNGTIAKIYGLIRIHKDNYPLRLVPSTLRTPTDNLATFLADILKLLTLHTSQRILLN